MARLRQDFREGTITNNPLLVAGTTLNSAALAELVAVTGSDILAITLDPKGAHGDPEIVHVTAHTAAATSATILRAQEGTVAREHPLGTVWQHNITAEDFEYANLPGLPTLGRLISITSIAQGTTEYVTPAGVTAILVDGWGAGAGGGGAATAGSQGAAGGGGGGGAFAQKLILDPDASYVVAVGAGGAGSVGAAQATNGGDTTFGSVLTAKGGVGAFGMAAGTTPETSYPGTGGPVASSVGDLTLYGSPGQPGLRWSGTKALGGSGGPGARGGAGGVASKDAQAGTIGQPWGGGGGGANVQNGSAAATGGTGANGRIIVYEFGE